MEPFELIGRMVVAIPLLWVGYGLTLLLFHAKVGIPPNAPWTVRLMGAAMFVLLAGWVLVRHQRVLGGFIMREYDAETGEPTGPCPCPACAAERQANG